MAHELELDGLVGSSPLAALAAFGLLRVLATGEPTTRLRWRRRDEWIAVLDTEFADVDALCASLHDSLSARATTDLEWTGDADLRVEPAMYRDALQAALDGNAAQADMLQAQAAYGAVDGAKGLIKPTAFYMVSGQMHFVRSLRELRETLLQAGPAAWHEALAGPWRYQTPLHSLGWDPAGERLHALRARAPTAERARCVAAAVWLAYEALPWFPCFSRWHNGNAGEQTLGFSGRGSERAWRWPIFTEPLDADELRFLLQSDLSQRRSGVAAVYASVRHTFGQGYAVFRPARRLC